jgi:hypothetical protein
MLQKCFCVLKKKNKTPCKLYDTFYACKSKRIYFNDETSLSLFFYYIVIFM